MPPNPPPTRRAWHHRCARTAHPVALLLLASVVALAVRLPFLGLESGDYRGYVSRWYDYLGTMGPTALGDRFADYTPAYLYVLLGLVFVPLPKLLAIKLTSIAFDFLLAAAVALLVGKCRPGRSAPAIAFAAVLVTPTVVLNSAAWGQCDAIYAAFVVLAVALVPRRPWLAMVCLGLAFAFKAQAIFLGPFVLVLLLRRQLSLASVLIVPAVLVASLIPAWLLGRPMGELLLIYREQSGNYEQLTLNAPSLYGWLPNYEDAAILGMVIGVGLMAAFVALAVRSLPALTPERLMVLALASLTLAPFVLPRMHDRYFFVADALSVAYAVVVPARGVPVSLLILTASTFSYFPFLFGLDPVPLPIRSALMAAALAIVLVDLFAPAAWRYALTFRRPALAHQKAARYGIPGGLDGSEAD